MRDSNTDRAATDPVLPSRRGAGAPNANRQPWRPPSRRGNEPIDLTDELGATSYDAVETTPEDWYDTAAITTDDDADATADLTEVDHPEDPGRQRPPRGGSFPTEISHREPYPVGRTPGSGVGGGLTEVDPAEDLIEVDSTEDLTETNPYDLATEPSNDDQTVIRTVVIGTSTAPPAPSWRTRFDRFIDAPKQSAPPLSPVEQLAQTQPPDRLMGWVVTGVITALAFFLRWFRLGRPEAVMFDETYYAKDAWSLLKLGYEGTWGEGSVANPLVLVGDDSSLTDVGTWVVHPPVGKWLIAIGEVLFGLNPFGWRFMALIFGTLLVFMVIRLARRLSRSTLIGGLAGLLLTFDGMAFVMSRIALLDIFQAFFIVAAVACVVADRDHFRNRLADRIRTLPGQTLAGRAGPFIFRGWLIVAGLMFGLGCATKWNTIYPLAVFGILVVCWSWSARRLAEAGYRSWWSLLIDGVPAFVSMVVLAAIVYVCSWIPWMRTSGGFDRNWGAQHPDDKAVQLFGDALGSLWHYHVDSYTWATGESMQNAEHSYASNPLGWLVNYRTTGIYAQNDIAPGDQGCTAVDGSTCMRIVTAFGTPLLWWLAAIALLVALIWWLAGQDWRFGVPVLGAYSTLVPWIFSNRGAMFSFYTITMVPFTVIALAMVMGVVMGPARSPRRQLGTIIVGTALALIILNFAFNYPIYTGELLTRQQWQWRMWLPGWV